MMFRLLIFLTTHVACNAYVRTLTDATFMEGISSNNILLVAFYSPRCGHSRRMLPHYRRAAATLQKHSPPVPLAKVNCLSGGKKTCWGIPFKFYPTITFYRNGSPVKNYEGQWEEQGIVRFAKSKAGWSSNRPNPACANDVRCSSYEINKDYYCREDQWTRQKCPEMCGLCSSNANNPGGTIESKEVIQNVVVERIKEKVVKPTQKVVVAPVA